MLLVSKVYTNNVSLLHLSQILELLRSATSFKWHFIQFLGHSSQTKNPSPKLLNINITKYPSEQKLEIVVDYLAHVCGSKLVKTYPA